MVTDHRQLLGVLQRPRHHQNRSRSIVLHILTSVVKSNGTIIMKEMIEIQEESRHLLEDRFSKVAGFFLRLLALSLLQRSSGVVGFHRIGVATVSLLLDIPRLSLGVPDRDAPGRSSIESFLDSFQTLSH